MNGRPPAGAASDAMVCLAFAAVPLAVWPQLPDPYTTAKWYALHVLAAAWLVVEVWACGSRGWPRFVRENPAAVAALSALAAWSALRGGLAWGRSPATDRVACAVLVLCAAWHFARNGGRTGAVVAGTSTALLATIGLGLAQAAGVPLPPVLAAREGPAALFGNVNMAAQFVGLALVLVVPAMDARGGASRVAAFVLAASGAAYLYLLATRSVLLALAAAAAALAWSGRRRLYVAGVAAAAVVLALVWLDPGARLDPALVAQKAQSTRLRLALWEDTLTLVRHRPLGVGAGNFEHAILPFQAAGRLEPREDVAFRSPHDEYLRYLAEDGAPFVAVAAVAGALLVLRWRRAAPPPALRALVVGWGAFLAVESLFQFPLALATGALAMSATVGAAMAAGREDEPAGPRATWRLGATAVAVLLTVSSLRSARSEQLPAARPNDVAALARACALDPRNLPACVTAAWLDATSGRTEAARSRLQGMLAHAPSYPPAVKLLGEIELAGGERAAGCARLLAYDALYRGRSAAHARVVESCAPGTVR